MRLFHIPQCSIHNRNVHISVLNGALWDMEQVHSRICELGQLTQCKWTILKIWDNWFTWIHTEIWYYPTKTRNALQLALSYTILKTEHEIPIFGTCLSDRRPSNFAIAIFAFLLGKHYVMGLPTENLIASSAQLTIIYMHRMMLETVAVILCPSAQEASWSH